MIKHTNLCLIDYACYVFVYSVLWIYKHSIFHRRTFHFWNKFPTQHGIIAEGNKTIIFAYNRTQFFDDHKQRA